MTTEKTALVLVLGSVLVKEGDFEAALALSLEHVHRSRQEPGCLAHDVHRDAEIPNRLVFVERWVDRPALMKHFAVPESQAFVQALTTTAVEPPKLEIFDATKLKGPFAP